MMFERFARYFRMFGRRGRSEEGEDDDDFSYDGYWLEFLDLYVELRSEYDRSRAALDWDRESYFPTVAIGIAIREAVEPLSDRDVLDTWRAFATGEDGAVFPWYESVRSLFEQRDEAVECGLSWKSLAWGWLYVVAGRYPQLELRYCGSLDSEDARLRSMLRLRVFTPERSS